VPVERTEPARVEAKLAREERWYQRFNAECTCTGPRRCGDRYRDVVAKIRGNCAMSTPAERHKLTIAQNNIRQYWPPYCAHYSKESPTCNLVNMPRELLPRMGRTAIIASDRWPFMSQRTIDDVLATRVIRNGKSTRAFADMWSTVQFRMKQYTARGEGTFAEAIMYNNSYWMDQLALIK
jgi:hypothetical protein